METDNAGAISFGHEVKVGPGPRTKNHLGPPQSVKVEPTTQKIRVQIKPA